MSFEILVAGCGEIGSRHLQGLARSKSSINITSLDLSNTSLELAKRRIDEMPKNDNIESVRFINKYAEIKEYYDFAIIATNAYHRRESIENILSKSNVKNLLLEKVAFQSIEDFSEVLNEVKRKKINAGLIVPEEFYLFINC